MKRSSISFVAFLALAVGLIYALSRITSRISQPEQPSLPSQVGTSYSTEPKTESVIAPVGEGRSLGSADAKVKIVAILPPSSCQAPTIRILDEIVKAEPKRVRVEIYGMDSPKGSQLLQQYGATCASVFINGKTEFTLTSNGETRHVICQKSPGMSYQSTDLIEIVHMELKRLYGKGFDEETLKALREKGRQIVGGGHGVSELSSPKAKVVVEVLTPAQQGTLYPLFAETIKSLERLKEKYGDALSVSIYPIVTEEGQKRLRELKLNGPAVIVNGRTVHEIAGPNKTKRKVITEVGMGGRIFSLKDVEDVVAAYMEQASKK
ncbi:MAG: hypothetical protein ACUVTP_05075 [Candidatus Fervidibacter sp.]|uniref:hypothetical protein n=1 Tax=Candidatus Fervidibacter sp. TaxID=3100871 RepID=UPI00404B0B47